ncbi:hypothetical protein VTN77DRAFT_5246 [Rasamsonia byssochlamydoides]|uniref:uncharacterized protein n=1 Tax=Rasamsonia byssochlamydoides TaxID=89139 RepID=UPI0037443628
MLLLSSIAVLSALQFVQASTATPTPLVTNPKTGVQYVGIAGSDGVESFLNIPFGQDTGGARRFAPPTPYVPPAGTVINATVAGPACPQQKVPLSFFPLFSNVTDISEDCLNLRIARPEGVSNGSKLPVMVYIYGGACCIYHTRYDMISRIEIFMTD